MGNIWGEIWRQSPLAAVMAIAVIAFARGSVVPSSSVTSAVKQCSENAQQIVQDRDLWQRIALQGTNILEKRAQAIADIAPTSTQPNGPAKMVKVEAKPIAPDVKASIEKPPTETDPTSVQKRIETSKKVLESAPVQVPVTQKAKT